MALSEEDRLYREDVFALEREAKREADILRLAEAHEITPETVLQGYLGHRWKRRNGDIYRSAAVPWYNFEPDPGWTGNTIRYRIMNIGAASTLQVIGDIQAPLGAQSRARVGILPTGFRPARNYRVAGVVLAGVTYGWSEWDIGPDGYVWTVWGVGSSTNTCTGSVNAIVPMD